MHVRARACVGACVHVVHCLRVHVRARVVVRISAARIHTDGVRVRCCERGGAALRPSVRTILRANSTPIVGLRSLPNSFFVYLVPAEMHSFYPRTPCGRQMGSTSIYRIRRLDFPTSVSPIIKTLNCEQRRKRRADLGTEVS